MLPTLRVQTLVQVAEDEYTSRTLKHREKMRESRTDRDLTGFYVYQNYLRRLRRLHRNYVSKYRQRQQEGQQQPLAGRQSQGHQLRHPHRHPSPPAPRLLLPNSHLKDEFSFTAATSPSGEGGHPTEPGGTSFRIQAVGSRDFLSHRGGHSTGAGAQPLLPAIGKTAMVAGVGTKLGGHDGGEGKDWKGGGEDDEDDVLGGCGQPDPIYIPCGRENSDLVRLQRQNRLEARRSHGGALSFSMWKNLHGHHTSLYST